MSRSGNRLELGGIFCATVRLKDFISPCELAEVLNTTPKRLKHKWMETMAVYQINLLSQSQTKTAIPVQGNYLCMQLKEVRRRQRGFQSCHGQEMWITSFSDQGPKKSREGGVGWKFKEQEEPWVASRSLNKRKKNSSFAKDSQTKASQWFHQPELDAGYRKRRITARVWPHLLQKYG